MGSGSFSGRAYRLEACTLDRGCPRSDPGAAAAGAAVWTSYATWGPKGRAACEQDSSRKSWRPWATLIPSAGLPWAVRNAVALAPGNNPVGTRKPAASRGLQATHPLRPESILGRGGDGRATVCAEAEVPERRPHPLTSPGGPWGRWGWDGGRGRGTGEALLQPAICCCQQRCSLPSMQTHCLSCLPCLVPSSCSSSPLPRGHHHGCADCRQMLGQPPGRSRHRAASTSLSAPGHPDLKPPESSRVGPALRHPNRSKVHPCKADTCEHAPPHGSDCSHRFTDFVLPLLLGS